ncbi:hypothetical protein A5848_001764, partial [Enterococcus faecium]
HFLLFLFFLKSVFLLEKHIFSKKFC